MKLCKNTPIWDKDTWLSNMPEPRKRRTLVIHPIDSTTKLLGGQQHYWFQDPQSLRPDQIIHAPWCAETIEEDIDAIIVFSWFVDAIVFEDTLPEDLARIHERSVDVKSSLVLSLRPIWQNYMRKGVDTTHQIIRPDRGLVNPGVLCFANAAVHLLRSMPIWFEHLDLMFEQQPFPPKSVSYYTSRFLRSLSPFRKPISDLREAPYFDKVFEAIELNPDRQNDSGEFLSMLLAKIDDADAHYVKPLITSRKENKYTFGTLNEDGTCERTMDLRLSLKEKNDIIWRPRPQSSYCFNTEEVSYPYFVYNIAMSEMHSQRCTSIQTWLQRTELDEPIADILNVFQIHHVESYLILHLGYELANSSLVEHKIDIPEFMTLHLDRTCHLALRSVTYHTGKDMRSGHYINRSIRGNRVIQYNDEKVTHITSKPWECNGYRPVVLLYKIY
jgi:hypothetical protein